MLDDFIGVDTALSFGINDNIEWDKVVADRASRFTFDHTVNDSVPHDARMRFHREMIAPEDEATAQSIASLVPQHDRGAGRPNIILKMDMEAAEWPCLEATPLEAIQRFWQITCKITG